MTTTIAVIRAARDLPILIGGRAVANEADAIEFGADGYSATAVEAIAWFESVAAAGHRPGNTER